MKQIASQMSLIRSGGKGISFSVGISCKTFEKRKPPVEVLATRVQKVKVNFNGDAPEGVISATLNKSARGGAKAKTKVKGKPRKSPAIKKRATSPTRSKPPVVATKPKPVSPTRKTSPKRTRKSPARVTKKK